MAIANLNTADFLQEGSNVTLTQDGNVITIASSGGGGGGALDDLTDVVITTPATDQVLKYNGTNWVNGAVTGITTEEQDQLELAYTSSMYLLTR